MLEPGDLRARVLVMLADIDYWRIGESAALTLAERALVDARDPLMRARCHVAIAMYAGTVDLPKAAVSARAAVALLEPHADAEAGLVAAALAAWFVPSSSSVTASTPRRPTGRSPSSRARRLRRSTHASCSSSASGSDTSTTSKARGGSSTQAEGQARDEGDDSSLANILLNRVILGDLGRRARRGHRAG